MVTKKHTSHKSNQLSLHFVIILVILIICLVITTLLGFYLAFSPKQPTPLKQNNSNLIAQGKKAIPTFNKKRYSNTNPSSLWVVVNKQHPLTRLNYAPSDLVLTNGANVSNVVKVDLEAMLGALTAQSIAITIVSSYRSYSYQVALYNNYLSNYGQVETDTFSARPGYSEHQTGLAIDVGSPDNTCNFDNCFSTTPAGEWLTTHAHEYGFILRYPADKQSVTGYKYEPWHFRYVGKSLAQEMKQTNISTLEDFFNINGGEIYK